MDIFGGLAQIGGLAQTGVTAQMGPGKFDDYFLSQIKGSYGITIEPWVLYTVYAAIGLVIAGVLSYYLLKRHGRLGDLENAIASGRRKLDYTLNSERFLLDFLRRNCLVFDVVVGDPKWYSIAARAIIIAVKRKTLRCEIIEDFATDVLDPGTPVTCTFKPIEVKGKKINHFTTTFNKFEVTTRRLVRFELNKPESFAIIKRRRHPRKRVLDQKFLRIKLWFDNSSRPRVDYFEAAPHLAVNAFDPRSRDSADNSVVNISKGGIAINAELALLSEQPEAGKEVVMNIFMYSVRDKIFKAYWYAGVVRSAEDIRPGYVRLGIQFTKAAYVDEENKFHWETV